MKPSNFAPFYRSTVGFDRLFDTLEGSASRADWPPYDIHKLGESQYRIRMAIAGFSQNDIELTQEGNTLAVVGRKKEEQGNGEALHQGIAFRNFRHTFSLADHVKVTAAALENGLLSVDLVREIPEQLKPRRITIETSQSRDTLQDNRSSRVESNRAEEAKAA